MQPGTKIGNLQVGNLAFTDAAGEVYYATVDPAQLRAMVRVFSAELSRDIAFLEKTLSALTSYGASRHPHLAQMVPVDLMGTMERWLVVNALGNADPLPELLSRDTLTATDAVQAFRQVISGLQAVHALGLFHGDIRPENIVLSSDGKAKLAGFAFAGLPAADRDARRAYQAPEARASGKPSASADLFALGVTFRNLFRVLGAGIPPELTALTERMACSDISDRPDDLTAVLAELAPRPNVPPPPAPAPAPAPVPAPTPITLAAPRSDVRIGTPSTPSAVNPTGYRPAFSKAPQISTSQWDDKPRDRTRTLQIDLENEMRASIKRDRMPSPMTIGVLVGLAIFFYIKIWPIIEKNGLDGVAAIAQREGEKVAQKLSGDDKIKQATAKALETKKAAEEYSARSIASTSAAADGEATPPPKENPN